MRKANYRDRFDPIQTERKVTAALLWSGMMSIIVVIATFAAVLLLFPMTRYLPQTIGSGETAKQIDWGLLEGMAGLAALSLVVGNMVFSFIGYRRSEIQESRERAQKSFSMYKEMYDKLTAPEAVTARRWIIQNLRTLEQMGGDKDAWLAHTKEQLDHKPEDWTQGRSPGREYLKQTLTSFDYIGFVDKYYWTIEYELVEWMSPLVAKVWERIHLYVEDEAERRNEPDFYLAARELGNQCLEWRRQRLPPSEIIKDAT